MFSHSNPLAPEVTHARLDKETIERNGNPPNVTLQYQEGRLVDGAFQSIGVGSICVKNASKLAEYLTLTSESSIETYLQVVLADPALAEEQLPAELPVV